MAKAKAVELTPELSERLKQWNAAEQALTAAKAAEFELRIQIVNALCEAKKLEGTETLEIGNGWKLKACKKQNYTLTNKQGETERLLAAIAPIRQDLAVALVQWKPDMAMKAYKELVGIVDTNPTIKEALAAALTIKPGAPTLELVAPEEKAAANVPA